MVNLLTWPKESNIKLLNYEERLTFEWWKITLLNDVYDQKVQWNESDCNLMHSEPLLFICACNKMKKSGQDA